MHATRKIAITGGLACGKSLVCHYLKELGAHVVSADAIVHQLLESDDDTQKKIMTHFGSQVLQSGRIHRKRLAESVFRDKESLQQLERILHPKVGEKIEAAYKKCMTSIFAAEVPLLYESGMDKMFDVCIAVLAPQEFCRERYIEGDYTLRAMNQMDVKKKAERADLVIYNDGNREKLRSQVTAIYEQLSEK